MGISLVFFILLIGAAWETYALQKRPGVASACWRRGDGAFGIAVLLVT